ncbi:MAG: nitroreductase family protein [Fervidobacterium sp.]|uniref:Nitroreductase n=1 Tax=Fervidobacterium gondwanense DSM 13020 TaxID=1121883 RepID=A0A1M7S880_FERGO|nr:nitroreductase family protein [Fervidobacterium gondwanense]SHN54643.1 Nitroreductase [Fervidobacterium gondwanense DSM 13020]
MELRDVILQRRSIRQYKNETVPYEKLQEIAKYALLAPSGRNQKPVDIVIVTDKHVIEKIKKSREGAFSFLSTAPACFVIVADESSSTWISDASIVASYVQLLAVDYGLSSCWGHAHERYYNNLSVEAEIKNILHVPSNYRVLCVIGIGYADEEKPYHSLQEVDNRKMHTNQW